MLCVVPMTPGLFYDPEHGVSWGPSPGLGKNVFAAAVGGTTPRGAETGCWGRHSCPLLSAASVRR